MTAIEVCRTAALGGHLERCDQCGHERNCLQLVPQSPLPKVSVAGPRRNGSRTAKPNFLTSQYFHVVFTVPEEIAAIAYQNKEAGLRHSLPGHRRDPDAPSPPIPNTWAPRSASSPCSTPGDQNLLLHPHLHCVVPGGGLSPDGQRWISCRPGFFLPVRVLSRLFRRLFLEYLAESIRCRQTAVLQLPGTAPRAACAFARHLAPS